MESISQAKNLLLSLTLVELERIAPGICERYWWAEGRRIGDTGHRIAPHAFKDEFAKRPALDRPVSNHAFWRGVLEGSMRFTFNRNRDGIKRGAAVAMISGRADFRWFMIEALYVDFPAWDREPENENTAISTCSTSSTMIGSKLVRDLINTLWPTGDEFIAKETFRGSIESIKVHSPNNAEQRRRNKAKILGIPMATIHATLTPDLGPRPDFQMYRPDFEESERGSDFKTVDAVLATGVSRVRGNRTSRQ